MHICKFHNFRAKKNKIAPAYSNQDFQHVLTHVTKKALWLKMSWSRRSRLRPSNCICTVNSARTTKVQKFLKSWVRKEFVFPSQGGETMKNSC